MFYEFNQNNSGGSFVVNDKLCHRLFIEADSSNEAIAKAEDLGCYWNGVEDGLDCPCCGDRWSCYWISPVDMNKFSTEGYTISAYSGGKEKWKKRYGNYEVIEKPHSVSSFGITRFEGKILFKTIEEYAQFLANEYGWTVPDIRIFYKDGEVLEIFKQTKET